MVFKVCIFSIWVVMVCSESICGLDETNQSVNAESFLGRYMNKNKLERREAIGVLQRDLDMDELDATERYERQRDLDDLHIENDRNNLNYVQMEELRKILHEHRKKELDIDGLDVMRRHELQKIFDWENKKQCDLCNWDIDMGRTDTHSCDLVNEEHNCNLGSYKHSRDMHNLDVMLQYMIRAEQRENEIFMEVLIYVSMLAFFGFLCYIISYFS